jgi:hypothetical protein
MRLDADRVLEIDDAKITALEGAIAAARKTAHEAAVAHERADRRQGALHARAQEADAAIAAARQALQAELASFGVAVNRGAADEARAAAQHLVAALSRGHALADAIGSLPTHSGFLGETKIPSPAPMQQPLIAGSRVEIQDGSHEDLLVTWRAEPSAAALASTLRPVAELRRRVAGHRAFAPPPPPAKPYVVQNRRAPEEIAAERAALESAAKPPRSTWVGRSWNTDQTRGARTAQAVGAEFNAVAGVDDSALESGAA